VEGEIAESAVNPACEIRIRMTVSDINISSWEILKTENIVLPGRFVPGRKC